MKVQNIGHWIRDYAYFLRGASLAFIYRKPPTHYLGHVIQSKKPIVLIPGVFLKWQFLKAVADPLSLQGHPIYAIERIGYNTKEIHASAKLIQDFIKEKNLRHVIIIAHSKGGLIGKYLLAFHNQEERIEKVVAIATPFEGSNLARWMPFRTTKELAPKSMVIGALSERKEVNHKIVSVFGVSDNHVRPVASCYLEGAKNIQIETRGHHQILFDKKLKEVVMAESN
jgi:pimeloyl-ACP methyl ester carboxylesterase